MNYAKERVISLENITSRPTKPAYIYCTFFMEHIIRESRRPGARNAARLLIILKFAPYWFPIASHFSLLETVRIFCYVLVPVSDTVTVKIDDEQAFLSSFRDLTNFHSYQIFAVKRVCVTCTPIHDHSPATQSPTHPPIHTHTQRTQLYTLRQHMYWLAT